MSLDVTEELRRQIRLASDSAGKTIMEYCTQAIAEKLARDGFLTGRVPDPDVVARERAFRREVSARRGNKPFEKTAAELIAEARSEREERL